MSFLSYDPNLRLPSAEELPDSDDTPVDNELQNFIPNLAYDILSGVWANRHDWFWGVDMGIYYHPEKPPLVPDGFLSLGVQRIKGVNLRLSYVLWEEAGIVPILVQEIVSKTYGGEYDQKMQDYAELGVLYYVIYNPFSGQKRRYKQRQPLEIYRLESGSYVLQSGNPLWLPEIGLGIGCEVGTYLGIRREWVYWYDENGCRYPTSQELADRERQRADRVQEQANQEQERANQEQERANQEQERADAEQQRADAEQQRADAEQERANQEQQRADRLAEYLRSQGIDPDNLS